MKLEILRPLHIRRASGDLHLKPGLVDLPDDDAVRLLSKRPDAVRQVETSGPVIEPAERPDGQPMTPIYWENGTGHILGPAVPEYLAKDGETFWIVTMFEGQIRWINADRLRSRKAFEQQRKPAAVERIKECR
jgi:hypothetical protein